MIPFFNDIQWGFINKIIKEKFITDNFVFIGGTALSAFHLQHRESDDIDLTWNPIDKVPDKSDFNKIEEYMYSNFKIEDLINIGEERERFIYQLKYGKNNLKVEFVKNLNFKFEKHITNKNTGSLKVAVIEDIFCQKLNYFSNETDNAKNAVDIHFILSKGKIKIKDYLKYLQMADDKCRQRGFLWSQPEFLLCDQWIENFDKVNFLKEKPEIDDVRRSLLFFHNKIIEQTQVYLGHKKHYQKS